METGWLMWELLGKDGNKVRLDIDGQPYEVDIVMAENGGLFDLA